MCLHMNVCSALFTVHNRVNNDHDIAVLARCFVVIESAHCTYMKTWHVCAIAEQFCWLHLCNRSP